MSKRMIKVISLILTVTLVLDVFTFPTTTAFASSGKDDNKVIISYEGDVTDVSPTEPTEEPKPYEEPKPSEEPQPSEEPKPSDEPTPSEEPKPSEEPQPSETLAPQPSAQPSDLAGPGTELIAEEYKPITLESIIDDKGLLTDEGLLSLKQLPFDGAKYSEIKDNGDETSTLKLYTNPIKFRNENGELEYIDNSIITDEANHTYENKASDVEVKMSENLNTSNAIEVNFKDYTIGFMPIKTLKKADGKSSAELSFIGSGEDKSKDKTWKKNKKYESVEYSKTFSNDANIKITPTSDGVKEDIVLNKMPKQTEFSYQLKVSNVVPILRPDGNLYFVDLQKGLQVAAVPIPSMYDSTPESGPIDIPVTLKKIDENTYIYTLYPDQEFLKNAKYPVVIDPTVTTQQGGIDDTQIKNRSANSNYCNLVDMRVGLDAATPGNLYRSLIKINQSGLDYINSVTSGSAITQVIYCAYQSYSGGSSSPTVELHQITNNWTNNLVTWNNQPSFGGIVTSQIVRSVGWYYWDISSIGLSGAASYGVLLKNDNEGLNMFKYFNTVQASVNSDCFAIRYFTPPTSVTLDAPGWTWINYNPTLSWTGIQPPDGTDLVGVQCTTDGVNWSWVPGVIGDYSNGYSTSINWPEGLYWVSVRGVNSNGTPGPSRVSNVPIYVDKTSPSTPTISSSPIASSTWTTNTIPNLNWGSATDTASGLNRVEYSIDGGSWATLGTAISGGIYKSIPDSGTHTISARCVDNAGNVGGSSSLTYKLDVAAPATPGQPTIAVHNGSVNSGNSISGDVNSGKSASVDVSFSAVEDFPSGRGNASYYDVIMIKDGVETVVKDNVAAGTYQVNNLDDNITYYFKIQAFDDLGNASAKSGATQATTEDRTAPNIDNGNVTINTLSWTNNTKPTVSWGTITDEGGGTTKVKYEVLEGLTVKKAGEWAYSANGSGVIDCSSLPDGEYTISIKAFDEKNNFSNAITFTYQKDTIFDENNVGIVAPENEDVVPLYGNTTYNVLAFATDPHFSSWKLDYALGTDPQESDFVDNVIASSNNGTALERTSPYIWNLTTLDDNRFYTLRITATDIAGNRVIKQYKVLYALDANAIAPFLTMTLLDTQNETIDESANISTSSVRAQYTPIAGMLGTLFVNDVEKDSQATNTDDLIFNPLEYNNGWVYPEGSQAFLRVMSENTSGDIYFSDTTYKLHKITDIFDNETDLTGFENTEISGAGKVNKIVNIVNNGGMEEDSDWNLGHWGDSSAVVQYSTDEKYLGARSAKITKSQTTGGASVLQELTLEKGKTYTFSGYIKTSNIAGSSGASLTVAYYNSQGTLSYKGTPTLTGTNDWKFYSVTFTVPSNATSATVQVYGTIYMASGTAWFDSMQLIDPSTINKSVFSNGGMEEDFNWDLDHWGDSSAVVQYSTDEKYAGARSAKITKAQATGGGSVLQELTLEKGKTYTFSGYIKTSNITGSSGASLTVAYYNSQGTLSYTGTPTLTGTNDWQFYSVTFTVPSNATSATVQVYGTVYMASGTAWFDCLQLIDPSSINSLNEFTNGGMEDDANWSMDCWGDSGAVAEYSTDEKYTGARSAKVTKSQTTGGASVIQELTLEKGKTYTFAGYVKTSNVTGTEGASLTVKHYNSDGTLRYRGTSVITGTNDWERYSVTFTIPSDATSAVVQVYGDLYEASGTAWFDSLQLYEGTTGSNITLANTRGVYNTNGSFRSVDQEINGRICYVNLTADETLPTNTDITYYLVHDKGQIEIQPNQLTELNISTNKAYLRAIMTTTNTSVAPRLESWSLDVMAIPFSDSVVIQNTFDVNARGFCELNGTVYDEEDQGIKLEGTEYPVTYPTSGSVLSTVRHTPGDVYEVFLLAEKDTEAQGTDIKYYVSTDGGSESSWQEIEPGADINDPSDWTMLNSKGDDVVLKAVLTGNGSTTPVLKSWTLKCRQTMAGEEHDIKLIDEPDNLSTLIDANYTTLLRWEPSKTSGVSYNIYRSTTPYFDLSNLTPLATTTNSFYSDYNLQFDTKFYYKVTAVKSMIGSDGISHPRQSLPSNEAWAHTVSANALNEKLGLQDYWTYSGFEAGGGTGYVNVANGNLVYKNTDLVISDPFLASVMSRTYNSMADTKTPMGYGWDFSFNTCLLKVYDQTGQNVVALVLKDGDGTFHKFDYISQTGEYADANGTFMKLTKVKNASNVVIGYQIKRKDDIKYYFDANTMKLKTFTNNNGTELTFRYDYDIDDGNDGIADTKDRGNLKEIVNSVGERITLNYYVDGSTPDQGDYIYINKNVDMLASIVWASTESTDTITYTYTYNDNDQLESIDATINGETTHVQTFNYNVNVDDNIQTTDYNVVIKDAENRITVVTTDWKGEVSAVYDPVKTAAGDTNPVLNNYLGDKYTFAVVDTEDAGTEKDRTTVTNSRGVAIVYNYDVNGLLASKADAMGHSITYGHNADCLVTSVRYNNTIGGAEKTIKNEYTYNANGNIELTKGYIKNAGDGDGSFTALGPQTSYTYYSNLPNKVDTMTVTQDASKTAVTKYTYDGNGNIETTTVAYGTLLAQTTTYDYYDTNDPDDPIDPIDPSGRMWQLKSVEDEYGNETRYLYDSKGRLSKQLQYDDADQYVRTVAAYTYDGFGRTDKMTQPFVTGTVAEQLYTDMNYDELGRLEQKINPDGTAEKWEYDLTGRLNIDRLGYMSGSEFIEKNRTSFEYDLLGRQTSVTLGNDPTIITDDTTSTVSYDYWDSSSQLSGNDADKITRTDAEGTQTIEYYDILGRVDHTALSDGTTAITTAQYTYDDIGNVIQAVGSAGTVTVAEYNALNQQVRTVVDPFNSSDNKANMNIEKLYTYDYVGNTKTVTEKVYKSEADQTNPQEITTENQYDVLSRLEKVKQANPNYGQAGEPQFIETNYEYNKETVLDGENYIKNVTQDALGYISETYFDELRRTTVSFNRGNTGDGDDAPGEYQKTTYSYTDTNGDKNNAMMLADTLTRTDGTKEVYTYSSTGRTLQIDYKNASDVIVESEAYVYDQLGQVLTESSTTGTVTHSTSYRYDRQGRTKSVWEGTYGANGVAVKVSDGLDIEYSYNNVGQVETINYNTSTGGEHNLVYVYDGYGRISEIRLDPVSGDNNTVRQYFYNATTGLLENTRDYREFATVTAALGDYIQTDYAYNSAGLVNEIKYTDADFVDANNSTGLTEKHTVTYDGKGQIIQEQQDTDYSTDVAVAAKVLYKGYGYDSIGRLVNAGSGDNVATTWTAWDSHTAYTYDLDGNRKSMDNGTDVMTYTYNQFNQLTDVAKNGAAYQTYQYDLRGNQTQEVTKDVLSVSIDGVTTKYDQTTTYAFDLRNQMSGTTISTPVANETTGAVTYKNEAPTYLYNAGGQRMKKYEPDDNNFAEDDTTKYFYTGSAVLYTTNNSNELMTENILDPDGQIIASKRFDDDYDSGTPYELANKYVFFHYDIRGSVTNIVRPDGSRIEGYEYDEFGNKQVAKYGANGQPTNNNKFKNEVTFTGSISDTSTGLQYMNARYYQPTTGRFLSQDTYTGNPYDPWTQHLYSYCGNNPTSYIDPTGHFFNFIAGAIGALVGGLVGAATTFVGDLLDDGKINTPGEQYVASTLGGATTGAIIGVTCGAATAAAAYAGAAVESATLEVSSYIKGEKELTWDNVGNSLANVGIDTVVNGTVSAATGKLSVSRFNKGWFKPKTFKTAVKSTYIKELIYKPAFTDFALDPVTSTAQTLINKEVRNTINGIISTSKKKNTSVKKLPKSTVYKRPR